MESLIAAIKQGIREKRRTVKFDALSEQQKSLRKKLDDSRNRRQGCVTGQFRDFTESMVAYLLLNDNQDDSNLLQPISYFSLFTFYKTIQQLTPKRKERIAYLVGRLFPIGNPSNESTKLANYKQDLLEARQAKKSGRPNIKIKKFTKELANQYLSLATPQLIDDFDLQCGYIRVSEWEE